MILKITGFDEFLGGKLNLLILSWYDMSRISRKKIQHFIYLRVLLYRYVFLLLVLWKYKKFKSESFESSDNPWVRRVELIVPAMEAPSVDQCIT